MNAPENEQFSCLIALLNKYEIPYWVDSGTLLGIMRDGKILEHDKDIDICLWTRDEPKLIKALDEFRDLGYIVASDSYKGTSYKYSLYPKRSLVDRIARKRPSLLQVQINLFNEDQTHAWCYASRVLGKYYVHGSSSSSRQFSLTTREKLLSLAKKVLLKIKYYNYRFFGNVEATTFPWAYVYQPGTWWIPKSYFLDTIFVKEHKCYVPKEWDKYLSLRYGNWQEPTESWYCWRDDKSLKRCSPEALLTACSISENSHESMILES